jgi:hypothetical protein
MTARLVFLKDLENILGFLVEGIFIEHADSPVLLDFDLIEPLFDGACDAHLFAKRSILE